jgi:hypothetical protein
VLQLLNLEMGVFRTPQCSRLDPTADSLSGYLMSREQPQARVDRLASEVFTEIVSQWHGKHLPLNPVAQKHRIEFEFVEADSDHSHPPVGSVAKLMPVGVAVSHALEIGAQPDKEVVAHVEVAVTTGPPDRSKVHVDHGWLRWYGELQSVVERRATEG